MAGYDRLTPEGVRFYAEVERLKENEVFVGFQAGHAAHSSDSGTTIDMASVAAFNELGTSTSPSRPFLRTTVDENEDKIVAMGERAARELATGGSAEQVLNKVGVFNVTLVQKTIVSGSFAPNAPGTIRAKGSSKPLIDTGQMRQSVHYVIRGKGGG